MLLFLLYFSWWLRHPRFRIGFCTRHSRWLLQCGGISNQPFLSRAWSTHQKRGLKVSKRLMKDLAFFTLLYVNNIWYKLNERSALDNFVCSIVAIRLNGGSSRIRPPTVFYRLCIVLGINLLHFCKVRWINNNAMSHKARRLLLYKISRKVLYILAVSASS